jgi:lipopolysaccharide transport system permease protein
MTKIPNSSRDTLRIIEAGRTRTYSLGCLWQDRELVYLLAKRDVLVRYKQTAVGIAWVVLQPLLLMLVLSFFFGRLPGITAGTSGVPYPVYVLAGLVLWTYFASAIQTSAQSVVANPQLVTKTTFPRILIPIAAILANVVDLACSFAVLFGFAAIFGAVQWTPSLLTLPLIVAATIAVASGLGLFFAALTVAYSDVRHALPFILQVWFFLSPVVYASTFVGPSWRWILAMNPLTGLIEGFRAALFALPQDWPQLGVAVVTSVAILSAGITYFSSVERQFADIV